MKTYRTVLLLVLAFLIGLGAQSLQAQVSSSANRILRAFMDPGGVTGAITFSNSQNLGVARSSGAGTVLFADPTSRNNVGFLKIYASGTAYYIPLFSAN